LILVDFDVFENGIDRNAPAITGVDQFDYSESSAVRGQWISQLASPCNSIPSGDDFTL